MSANLILIPTALENGKEITAPRSQENDQNSNLASGNSPQIYHAQQPIAKSLKSASGGAA